MFYTDLGSAHGVGQILNFLIAGVASAPAELIPRTSNGALLPLDLGLAYRGAVRQDVEQARNWVESAGRTGA